VRDCKPPFVLPTMAQLRARPSHAAQVASLFAGCGGSCLGYQAAGFLVVWANEFIPAAQAVYTLNHPATPLDPRDVRLIDPADVLTACHLAVGELALLDGSPPCASFSTAGSRATGWGQAHPYSDTVQRTDDLFDHYVRFVQALQPKVFVAENVSGLVKGVAKGVFKELFRTLSACGYQVEARLLDAQWLGVPQQRERLFFQGVRLDLGRSPAWPTPLPYRYSVRDALPWVTHVALRRDVYVDATTTPARTILATTGRRSSSTFAGEGLSYVQVEGVPGASPTRRKMTIPELKRICTFPEDFVLLGTYAQQWERLGRAVPPRMMEALARAISVHVLGVTPSPQETP
jgi:DNA (cytosine-5)-methyltransferase 1